MPTTSSVSDTGLIVINATYDPTHRTAVQQVLETPELLEHILYSLRPVHVLHAARVCHTFKNTIAGSIALQRKLFLQPVADTSTEPLEPNELLERLHRGSKNKHLTFTKPGNGKPWHLRFLTPKSYGVVL